MSTNIVNFILLLIMGTTWGLHFSLVKLLVDRGMDFFVILFLSLAGIFVVFAVTLFARREGMAIRKSDIPFISVSALLGYALPIGIELIVAVYIDATILTLVVTSTPIFAIIVARVILRDRISISANIAALIGMIAAAALLLPDSALPESSNRYWLIVAFFVPLIYASYNHYVDRKWPDGLGLFQMAYWESLLAAILALPFFVMALNIAVMETLAANVEYVALLVVVTAIEVWTFFELVRRAGGIYVSFASFGALISGAFWGAVIFQDEITNWMMFSFAMISIALVLCSINIKIPYFFKIKKGAE